LEKIHINLYASTYLYAKMEIPILEKEKRKEKT
jgi:hypothetical protein